MSVYLLILTTTLCTIAGQLILKRAVTALKPLLDSGPIDFLIGAAFSPLVIAFTTMYRNRSCERPNPNAPMDEILFQVSNMSG